MPDEILQVKWTGAALTLRTYRFAANLVITRSGARNPCVTEVAPYLRKQLERWRHAVLARLGVSVMRSRRKADGELYDGKLSRTVRRAETHL